MASEKPRSHPPLVVIANEQEWHTRSLESVLGPHGYAVLRAYSGRQTLERCWAAQPDMIIVDTELPDIDGFEVVRQLRADPRITPSTPIVMTCPGHATRQKRLEALKAGAWDFLGSAVDAEELPLKLNAYVSAKFDADRAREDSLTDQLTGLYNIRGLARRARELGSQAFRAHEPLACIVLSPVLESNQEADPKMSEAVAGAIEQLAKALRDTGRVSDAIGRLGPTEFAVVAQGADEAGARRMAERLQEAAEKIQQEQGQGPHLKLCAGFDAVGNYRDAPIDPADMLVRATMAMRLSRQDPGGIRRFEATTN